MKPAWLCFPYMTYDLTEVKVHMIDGKVVGYIPKTYELAQETPMKDSSGKDVVLKQYTVTEWSKVKIA